MSDNVYTVKVSDESGIRQSGNDTEGGQKKQYSSRGRQSKCRGCGEFFNTWEGVKDLVGRIWCGDDCRFDAWCPHE